MPYPNEHACRLADPSGFKKDTFRRKKSGKVSLILAKKPGSDTMTLQSIRYPISDWSEKAARSSCKERGGAFEAASKEEKIAEISAEELLELAEQNPELADYELVRKALDVQVVEGEEKEAGMAEEEKVMEEKIVEKETVPILSKFFSVKGKDDKDYWVSLSGSSFKDRENEIIAKKAILYGIAHGDKTGQRGELRLYHYPNSRVGECQFQMLVGNFLVEAGTWDDTPRALGAKKWTEKNDAGNSVGFFYNPKKFKRDKALDAMVYEDEIILFERSILKRKHASCPWATVSTIQGGLKAMSHKKDLVEMIGEEETKAVLEGAKDASKDLENLGVAFKEDQEKVPGEGLLEQVKDLSEDDLKAHYAQVGKLLKVEEKEVEEEVEEEQEVEEKQVEAPEEVQFQLDDAAIKAIAEIVKEALPDNSKLEAEIVALKEATESASKMLTEQVEAKVKEVFGDLPKATIYRATKVTEEEPKEEPKTTWVSPLDLDFEDGIREIEKAREAGR